MKKKTWIAVLFLLLSLVMVSGCKDLDGALRKVKVGEDIILTLESNPTTGYQWQLAQPIDDKIISFKSLRYQMPNTKRIGAGGFEIWTFKALSRGETKIALKYVRAWEKDTLPIKAQVFDVQVFD